MNDRDDRRQEDPLRRIANAALGAVTMTAERADELAESLAERGGTRLPDDPPGSEREVERGTPVPGRVELLTGRERPARVMGADRAPRSRFVTAALDEVLDDEVGRRLFAGKVELGFAPIGIQWQSPSLP